MVPQRLARSRPGITFVIEKVGEEMFTGDPELTGHSTTGSSRAGSASAGSRTAHAHSPSQVPAVGPDSAPVRLDSIDRAIADIAAGKAVVVVDDEDRENEGDIIFAAEKATTELVAFTVRYSSGYLCTPLTGADCDRLGLPPMYQSNEDPHNTAYTVTVDARADVTTGISARDRATTIHRLAEPNSMAGDFTRPGHVVPLRARAGGVLERPGHTEAAIDLARLAGLTSAGVVCEIVSEKDPRTMARAPELREFADEHGLALVSIADLAAWRRTHERLLERGPEAYIPTAHGKFRAVGYTGTVDGREHVALIADGAAPTGAPRIGSAVPATSAPGVSTPTAHGPTDHGVTSVRIHSECLTGDVFGSLRCECGHDLGSAMEAVATEGNGIVVYLRGQGAQDEGLMHTLKSFTLRQTDPESAEPAMDAAPSAADFDLAGQMLADLGVRSVRLLTCPADAAVVEALGDSALAAHGITVVEHRSIIRETSTAPAASA